MACYFTWFNNGDCGTRFSSHVTTMIKGVGYHQSFSARWGDSSHLSFQSLRGGLDCIERSLQVGKNYIMTSPQKQVLQAKYARILKHVRFFVHCQRPPWFDCWSRKCCQGRRCGTYNIKCSFWTLWKLCARSVNSSDTPKLWSIII